MNPFCKILSVIFLGIFLRCFLFSDLNLEEMGQDFVLETKRIEIPGYPHAFNPSIIRLNGSLLLSFRDIPDVRAKYNSNLGLVWLDDSFNVNSTPQILDIQGTSPIASRAEDGRLIKINDRLFLVYSDNKDLKISKGGFRVYLAEVLFDGVSFTLKNIECLSKFERETKSLREKNWTPFEYNGNLLLAYSLNPHRIFRPLLGTGECETFALSEGRIQWNWGELRGGTPGLNIDGMQYLAFFHSSIDMASSHSEGKTIAHYFMGAYTFSLNPPFEITQISPEPIIGKNFYTGTVYKPYWKPVRVVFPGGYIFDNKYIWVAYGREDHEVWIVKIDKERLLRSLFPVCD